jgi:hypothetical protein
MADGNQGSGGGGNQGPGGNEGPGGKGGPGGNQGPGVQAAAIRTNSTFRSTAQNTK